MWPVVVVGAGPAGCAAAILLAQRGVQTLLVDRWPEVYPQPRAVHLDDEVHRILGRLHVDDEFAAISRPALGLQLVDRRLRTIGRIVRDPSSSVQGYPQANMFDQPALEAVLRRRLIQLDAISFRSGVEVESVEFGPADGSPATIVLSDRVSGGTERIAARFVVGADGSHSAVRASIGASLRTLGFEQRWLVIDAEIDDGLGHWEGVHQLCDSRRAGTYMRIGATRHRWEFRLLEHETSADFSTPEQVEALIRPWLGHRPLTDVRIVRAAEYTFRGAVADRWSRGPVFLIGDAAHLTPPFIGQGMGAGLRDAANLTWKLAGVIEGGMDPSVLETYEQERRPHATLMIRAAMLLGVTMTGGGRPGDLVRQAVTPVVARALARVGPFAEGATPALRRSPLVTRGLRDRLAGRLCPNVCDLGRLDSLTEGRWALVSRVPLSPSVIAAASTCDCAVVDADGAMASWLEAADRPAALIRPDGTVMASGEPVDLTGALIALAG